MKKIFFCLCIALIISGCGIKGVGPYGAITQNTDSQIFVLSDHDISKSKDKLTIDETTIVIVGAKDGQDIKSIFNHAMDKIEILFKQKLKGYD